MKSLIMACLAACALIGAAHAAQGESAATKLAAATSAAKDCLEKSRTDAGTKDLGLQRTETGLRWASLAPGDRLGPTPSDIDYLYVHYVGLLEDGSVFDSSYSREAPFHFNIGMVVRGWTEGLKLLHPGEEACLLLPPELAYGPFGAGDKVPPDASLIFYVKLLGIVQPGGRRIGVFE